MPVAEQAALPDAGIPSPFRIAARTVTGTCRSPLFCGRPHAVGGHQPSSIAFALRAPRALTWGIQMMKFPRRRFLHLATGAAALPAVSRGRVGADLSVAAGAHHRSLSCRPSNRQHRAPHGSIAVGAAWAGIRY